MLQFAGRKLGNSYSVKFLSTKVNKEKTKYGRIIKKRKKVQTNSLLRFLTSSSSYLAKPSSKTTMNDKSVTVKSPSLDNHEY